MAATRATLTASQPRSIIVRLHGWGDGSGNGWLPPLMAIPQRFRRANQNGSGRQLAGTESPGKSVPVTIWAATDADRDRVLEDLCAMQGYPVQLADPYGRTLTIQIDQVDLRPRRGRGPIVSGTSQARWKIEGTLQVERLA